MDTKKKGSGRRRGNLILGGPDQKDTSKMTEDERREYRKTRKEYTDRQRFERMRRDPLDFLPSDQFTGDCTPTLRTESEVQAAPLLVEHSFASKDILVLRVAEKANLRGIECSTTRSDILSFKCTGHRFLVEAHHSELNGKVCATREGDDFPGIFVPVDDVNDQSTPKKSPYRSEWIKDLISNTISEMPSASNQVLRQQLMAYGKPYAITDALIQAARTKARAEIFGDANENCKYVHHIQEALEKEGHIVKLRETSQRETIQNVERIVIHDELLRLKQFDGSTMLPADRRTFVNKWKEDHQEFLVDQLGSKNDGLNFLNGIFFVPSFAPQTVPHLKDMFMADACHLNFGKYTLFSCYGITANANMSGGFCYSVWQ